MALTLFARRPAPADLPPLEPEPWPEIGETWKPEGVTIAQRYYNQVHSIVLVYTTKNSATGYVVACLGCHYASARHERHSLKTSLSLADAAQKANEHATTCRALPRDLPARPDDDTAREQLHAWVRRARNRVEDVQLWLSDLNLSRLNLQRSDQWIVGVLEQLAVDQPEILRISRSDYGDHQYVSYYARRLPER